MNTDAHHKTGSVVVGVDGSGYAQEAVDWAADEAVLRGSRLELLHACGPQADEARNQGDELLHEAGVEALAYHQAQARRLHPGLDVATRIVHEKPAKALEQAGRRAGLLVVGRRGLGGFTGMLVGSVSRKLAGCAPCPLLVATFGEHASADDTANAVGGQARGSSVVVGVSDASCASAVDVAFEEAALRGVPVRAIRAWSLPPVPTFAFMASQANPSDEVFRAAQRDSEAVLRGVVGPLRARYPAVQATDEVVHRAPADALVAISAEAVLTVIAVHRRAHEIGRTLGAVAYALLHHARSPVLMVPVR